MYVFAPGLGIAKRSGTQALITLAGAVLNTILNFLMIPVWGIVGAAGATLISAALVFAAYMTVSQRLWFVPHAWGRLAAATAAVAAIGLVGLLLPLPSGLAILVKLGLVLVTIGVVVQLRLIDLRDVRAALGRLRESRFVP